MNIEVVEQLRRNYKIMEKENKFHFLSHNQTWFSQIIQNPTLILGANISAAEWDLWSAFVYHKRNFAKAKNAKKSNLIFQMVSNECAVSKNNFDKHWFHPLFNANFTFSKQWELLSKILSK